MADFLSTLVARSLGQLPSVMPRRASRFEGDGASPPIDEVEAIEVAEPRRHASNPAARRNVRTELPTREREDVEARDSDQAVKGSMEDLQPGAPSPSIEVVERQVVQRGSDELETAHPVGERPSATDTSAFRPDEDPKGPRVRGVREVVHADPREQNGARDASSTASERQRPDAEGWIPPLTEPSQVTDLDLVESSRKAPPERGEPLRVPTTIVASDRGEEPSRRVDPKPSPRVTVTIGRIEVKAPSPQASPPVRPTPRPQPPRMSLDDYLRRERGRR